MKTVRQYIPETYLAGKAALQTEDIRKLALKKHYVLKESVSSGMKGVFFSDEPDFQDVLQKVQASNMNWVLQEEVSNKPQTFSWFCGDNRNTPEIKTADDWFMRVTVQYVNRKVGDVVVTARRNRAVHGAPDCLQLGTMIL